MTYCITNLWHCDIVPTDSFFITNIWQGETHIKTLIFHQHFTRNLKSSSLPTDVRWGSFVTRNECVTNEPQRTSAGRLTKQVSYFFRLVSWRVNLFLYFKLSVEMRLKRHPYLKKSFLSSQHRSNESIVTFLSFKRDLMKEHDSSEFFLLLAIETDM